MMWQPLAFQKASRGSFFPFMTLIFSTVQFSKWKHLLLHFADCQKQISIELERSTNKICKNCHHHHRQYILPKLIMIPDGCSRWRQPQSGRPSPTWTWSTPAGLISAPFQSPKPILYLWQVRLQPQDLLLGVGGAKTSHHIGSLLFGNLNPLL